MIKGQTNLAAKNYRCDCPSLAGEDEMDDAEWQKGRVPRGRDKEVESCRR